MFMSVIMMVAGAGMFLYPTYTDIYSSRQQDQLAEQFVSPEFKTKFASGNIEQGQVLTRIAISKIGVNALIVEGTEPKALRAGAGHYTKTALPCEDGNVGIAGHRTTYGKPFNRLDELQVGDVIELVTPQKKCRYSVVEGPGGKKRPRSGSAAWITTPFDGGVISRMSGSMLTLTTCHPKGSAAERLIVRAKLLSA